MQGVLIPGKVVLSDCVNINVEFPGILGLKPSLSLASGGRNPAVSVATVPAQVWGVMGVHACWHFRSDI